MRDRARASGMGQAGRTATVDHADRRGLAAERPALCEALAQLHAGDTLMVWRLDRLGRSLKDLAAHAESLHTQGVGMWSLKEAIDTDPAPGSSSSTSSARSRSSSGR